MESLTEANEAAARLTGDLVVPRGYDATMAVALAVLIVTGAVDSRYQSGWSSGLFLGSIALFFPISAWSIRRFKNVNGFWVSGMRRGMTVPATIGVMLVYAAGITAAVGAAAEGRWWLVGLIATAAACAYVAASRWWMRLYRKEMEQRP